MRISLLAVVVALTDLTTASALAEVGEQTRYHYEMCTCTFGYGKACATAVSCTNEGGYCSGSCKGETKAAPPRRFFVCAARQTFVSAR